MVSQTWKLNSVSTTNTVSTGREGSFYKEGVLIIQDGTAYLNPSIIKLELSGDVHPLSGPTTPNCLICPKAMSKRHCRHAASTYPMLNIND